MKVRLFHIILIFLFVLLINTGCVTNVSNMTSVPTTSVEPSAEQANQKQLTLEEEYQYLWESKTPSTSPVATLHPSSSKEKKPDLLYIHFIDVGQGDSILIQSDEKTMLVDSGDSLSSDKVINFIKSKNISRLDFVIVTHPHEDHMGAMAEIIETFDTGEIIMPKVMNDTVEFKNLLSTIAKKDKSITTPVPGTNYDLGKSQFMIIAPNSTSYKDIDDYSVVIKLTFSKKSFLFCGDAGQESMKEMLAQDKYSLNAYVLKISNHGSKSALNTDFFEKVKFSEAVISLGKSKEDEYPDKDVLEAIKNIGYSVYRTDLTGNITMTSVEEGPLFISPQNQYSERASWE